MLCCSTPDVLYQSDTIFLTTTTAAQNGVTLSYHKVRGLYFQAVVFVRNIKISTPYCTTIPHGNSKSLTKLCSFSVRGLGPLRTEEKSFRTGYQDCLTEVAKILMFSPSIDDPTRQKLVSFSAKTNLMLLVEHPC